MDQDVPFTPNYVEVPAGAGRVSKLIEPAWKKQKADQDAGPLEYFYNDRPQNRPAGNWFGVPARGSQEQEPPSIPPWHRNKSAVMDREVQTPSDSQDYRQRVEKNETPSPPNSNTWAEWGDQEDAAMEDAQEGAELPAVDNNAGDDHANSASDDDDNNAGRAKVG